MIVVQYRTTVVCDQCQKRDVTVTTGPPQQTVPINWVQGQPAGTTSMKEFCSQECMNNWQNPIRPWKDDDEPAVTSKP